MSSTPIILLASFAVIWVASGVIVSGAEYISKKLKIGTFIVSFFVLGFFTSIPELTIGINSIVQSEPEIFVGNLLGSTAVLFLLIIPILAIAGKSIKLDKHHRGTFLIATLLVILLPPLLLINKSIQLIDSIIIISCFVVLMVFMFTRKDAKKSKPQVRAKGTNKKVIIATVKILLGAFAIMIAANFVVGKSIESAGLLNISPFVISIIGISIGSNLPELVIGVRSVLAGKKCIAFGNYLGSACVNALHMGVLSLANFIKTGKPLAIDGHQYVLWFLVIGILLFFIFSRSKDNISRKEGLILLAVYAVFVAVELILHT